MTSEDIINTLDPDMFKCFITNQWIKTNDECKWFVSYLPASHTDYLKCLNCPRSSYHLNRDFNHDPR